MGSDDPQNTKLLERHLVMNDHDAISHENLQTDTIPTTAAKANNPQHKRKSISVEQELLDCIVVEAPPSQLRRRR